MELLSLQTSKGKYIMAVHSADNNSKTPRQEERADDRDNTTRESYPRTERMGAARSFTRYTAPISIQQGSGYSMEFHKEFTKLIESEKGKGIPLEFQVRVLDSSYDSGMKIAVLLLGVKSLSEPHLGAAIVPLLLERTCNEYKMEVVNISGRDGRDRKVDEQITADDGADDIMFNAATRMATSMFTTVQRDDIVVVAPMVVHSTVSANAESAAEIFKIAGNAAYNALIQRGENTITNPLNELAENQRFTIRPAWEKKTLIDAFGNYYRSDFSLELTAREKNGRRPGESRSLNGGGGETTELKTHGYLTMNYAGVDEDYQGRDPREERLVDSRVYVAQAVLNNIDTGVLPGPVPVTLAISMNNALAYRKNWVNIIARPPVSDKLHSLGVLSCESPLDPEKPIYGITPFDNSEEGVRDRLDFINRLFRPEPELMVQIPEAGPQTASLDFIRLVAAAQAGNRILDGNGVDIAAMALENYITELDLATSGVFSQLYNNEVMFEKRNQIYTGTMTLPDGSTASVEEVDYLAVATAVFGNGQAGDPKKQRVDRTTPVIPWSDSFNDEYMTQVEAMAIRRRIQTNLFGNFNETGSSCLYLVCPDFLSILNEAFSKSKFSPFLAGTKDAVEDQQRATYRASTMSSTSRYGRRSFRDDDRDDRDRRDDYSYSRYR